MIQKLKCMKIKMTTRQFSKQAKKNGINKYKYHQLCDKYTYIHINILYRSTDCI